MTTVATRQRDAHKTASIRRPRDQQPTTAARRGRAATSSRKPSTRSSAKRSTTLIDDLTRPIAVEKRLVTGSTKRALVALTSVAVLSALVAALFVLPVQAWFRQRDDIAKRQHELDVIRNANATLDAELARLHTDEGARQAARDELGYISRNERRYTMVDDANASLTLPGGWPFDTIGQILAKHNTLAPRVVAKPVAKPAPGKPSAGTLLAPKR